MRNIIKKLAVFTVIVSVFLIPMFAFAAPETEGPNNTSNATTSKDTKDNTQNTRNRDSKDNTQNTTYRDTTEKVEGSKPDKEGGKENGSNERSKDGDGKEKINSANKDGGALLPPSPPMAKPAEIFTEKGMGENLLVVALGVGIFAFLVAMVAVISAKSINGYIKTSMNKRIDKLSLQIQDLERKLSNEIEKSATAARSYEKQLESVRENQSRAATLLTKAASTPVAHEKTNVASESAPKRDNSAKFLEDYHSLMKLRGISQRNAKEEFFNKYSIKAFACKNIDARLNNSSIAAIYEETTESARFWGYLYNGELLVVPALPFSYDNIAHGPGAMGEVFASNFNSGSFEKLEVITPAVFTERLRFVKKGEIKLIA